MDLFQLGASVGLDITEFSNNVKAAKDEADSLNTAIAGIGKDAPSMAGFDKGINASFSDVDDKLSKLDQEIAGLDAEIAALDDEYDSLTINEDIDGSISKLDDLNTKGLAVQSAIDGVVNAIGEMVGKAIEGLFEFGSEALQKAAESGSDAANQYKKSVAELEATTGVLSEKTGELLLPIATAWNDFLETLSGVTDLEKLDYMAQSLDSYKFERIEALKENLGEVFDLFEKYEPPSPDDALGIGGMTENLDSQTAFWQDYAATLASLKEKDIDPAFLAELADGSVESLATLKDLDASDTEGLAAVQAAFEEAEAAKAAVAESIANTQMQIDSTVDQMVSSMSFLAAGMNVSAPAGSNATATGNAIIDGLAATYPGIAAQVDKIKAKVAELGGYSGVSVDSGTGWVTDASRLKIYQKTTSVRGFDTGIDYVPSNNYPARLHEGEAVLTKIEAEDWRRSRAGGGGEEAAGGVSVVVNIGTASMRDERDIKTLAREIADYTRRENYGVGARA